MAATKPQKLYRNIIATADAIKGLSASSLGQDTGLIVAPTSSDATSPFPQTLPSPQPIVDTLIADGIPLEVAKRLSIAFEKSVDVLRKKVESGLNEAWAQIMKTPRHASMTPLPELKAQLWSTHESLFSRKVGSWREEIRQRASARLSERNVGQTSKAVSTSTNDDRRAFNNKYTPVLETYFSKNQLPSKADKIVLAEKSCMTYRQIHVWFQNRRKRTKNPATNSACVDVRTHMLDAQDGNDEEAERTDVEDDVNDKLGCSSRSSSCTLVGDEDVFANSIPSYAFPAIYPPILDEDPFPCRYGDFSSIPKVHWVRKPATEIRHQGVTDMETLVGAFERLHISGARSTGNGEHSLPWGLYRPTKRSGCDVTLPYTVRPLRAPLASFIRLPTSNTVSSPCPAPVQSPRKPEVLLCVPPTATITETTKSSRKPRPRLPTAAHTCNAPSSVKTAVQQVETSPSSSSDTPLSMPIASASTPSADAHVRAKRVSKKKGGSKGHPPTGRGKGKGKSKVTTPSRPSTPFLSSSSSFDTSSRSPSLDSDSSLPSLSYSSSSSSASSDTHSPVIPLQSLPEERPLPEFHSFGGADTSLLLPPAQSLLESFPPPVFPSDDNSFPFDFSKGPLDYTFNYDLPPYPTFSQPLDGFSQGLHFSPFATPAPLSFDFNSISV
ncbi:hypothetical protein DFH11DRAFT_1654653 [Phellopilus nigrolimitatus]|nr:hypothetical protein DFH11DRAFT_1654653 [Phellopilus nigrolimitatus]